MVHYEGWQQHRCAPTAFVVIGEVFEQY